LNFLRRAGKAVTKTNEIVGKTAALLIFPLMLIMVSEVFLRHVFMLPSRYNYDLALMTYVTLVVLGAGYSLSRDVHIKVDVFYNRLKRRGKIIINMISYPAFFFLLMAAILDVLFRYVIFAWQSAEVGLQSPWRYPMWPIRTIMFTGILLMTLQGIVKFAEIFKKPEKGDEP